MPQRIIRLDNASEKIFLKPAGDAVCMCRMLGKSIVFTHIFVNH